MKRFFFIIGVLTLLTACTQKIADEVYDGQRPITFDNLNNRVTSRSANDTQDDYKLYASTSLSREWFIVDEVWGKTSGTYRANVPKNGPYYWLPLPYTFDFYAYAPAKTPNVVVGSKFPDLRIGYEVSNQADEDFTVASIKEINYSKKSNQAVSLLFHHMLAKVNIKVVLSDQLQKQGYTISSFAGADLGVIKNTGIIVLSEEKDWQILPGSSSNQIFYKGRSSYLIMPQAAPGCVAQVRGLRIIQAGKEVFKGDLKLYRLKDKDVQNNSFERGKAYNLIFKVDADATNDDGSERLFDTEMTFTATAADWTEKTINP